MSDPNPLPYETTLEIRDRCLCLHVQRAARRLARRFDEALRPFGLTSGQFSLLMSLNRPEPPLIGDVASLLGMDRTTLTAALKPAERAGWLSVIEDAKDRRGRRLVLLPEGKRLIARAVPVWRSVHDELDADLADPAQLRRDLNALGMGPKKDKIAAA
jgi:DNA-binding MarR family transcriptional regulator